jgi:hypothetical protein
MIRKSQSNSISIGTARMIFKMIKHIRNHLLFRYFGVLIRILVLFLLPRLILQLFSFTILLNLQFFHFPFLFFHF